ncbi:MAG: hypothetical protein RLZZ362_1405, partial [Actinomycetota bacterium]
GVERAVDLASGGIDRVRGAGSPVSTVSSIRCAFRDGDVEVDLVTPRRTAGWAFTDPTVDGFVRMIDGVCTAIDSLTPQECTRPVLIDAPLRLSELLDQPNKATDAQQAAIGRLLHRIDERGVTAAWAQLRP